MQHSYIIYFKGSVQWCQCISGANTDLKPEDCPEVGIELRENTWKATTGKGGPSGLRADGGKGVSISGEKQVVAATTEAQREPVCTEWNFGTILE